MKLKDLVKRFNWIKDAKGVATSLIEATATIGVGAVLAGVAVGAGISAVSDAKYQTASEDVRRIGEGVLTFYSHNNFYPMFKDGQLTGAQNDAFSHLVSANGTYPAADLDGTSVGAVGASWGVPATGLAHSTTGFSGHALESNHDSLEGHLVNNEIGFFTSAASSYPERGDWAGDSQRGFFGPYVQNLPTSDPWGNKYMVNVQELHVAHLTAAAFQTQHDYTPGGALPQMAVVVCSAGENRTIETTSEQLSNRATVLGDDICFRVK